MSNGTNIITNNELGNKDEENILKSAIKCEESGRLFRIVRPELEFFNKLSPCLICLKYKLE